MKGVKADKMKSKFNFPKTSFYMPGFHKEPKKIKELSKQGLPCSPELKFQAKKESAGHLPTHMPLEPNHTVVLS